MEGGDDAGAKSKLSWVNLRPERRVVFNEGSINSREAKLVIDNISDGIVAFKLKTTSPKTYLVKPSQGVIAHGESAHIKVIFQPAWVNDESNSGAGNGFNNKDRAGDKFLLQVAKIDKSALAAPRDVWKGIEKKDTEECRICVHITSANEAKSEDGPNTIYAPSPQFLAQMKELQRENFKLSQEIEHLKQTILSIQSVEDSSKGIFNYIKIDIWHIPLLLVGLVVVWYLFSKSTTQEL